MCRWCGKPLDKEGSAAREQAELVLQAAASCMIGVVFKIGQDSAEADMVSDFARRVIATALKLQYEPHTIKRQALQA